MAVIPMPEPRTLQRLEADEGDRSQLPPDGERRDKKKRDKVRSAWISFVGRIVAQVVGGLVTVALTLFVVQRAQQTAAPPADTTTRAAATVSAPAIDARSTTAAGGGELALAVLPLDNFSSDQAHGHFADGMTEALIAELSQIKGIRVISRTSSMQYRGSRKLLPEIARELGVTHIIEGSVARDRERVRVTAQLIEAASDRHVWAASYERNTRDVLGIQAEVASAIAREVGGTVVAAEKARLKLGEPG